MVSGLLWDGIRYWVTPFPHHLMVMGYARGLKELGARQRRCRSAWQPHLVRSRSLILEAADRSVQNGKALILGSGLLFDIPLAELSWRFREVTLVDILHFWRVRQAVRRYSNVHLHRLDITGIVKMVHAMARRGRGLDVPERTPEFFLEDGFDLVVSANVLSQLPLAPVNYATHRNRKLTPEETKAFSRRLVINHLDWLASFAGNVCLMSDLERQYSDGENVVCRERSLWGVELPEGGREWLWDLAPMPEIEPKFDVRHRVVGYSAFPKQIWLEQRDALTGS